MQTETENCFGSAIANHVDAPSAALSSFLFPNRPSAVAVCDMGGSRILAQSEIGTYEYHII
jgi:hypothetical protein